MTKFKTITPQKAAQWLAKGEAMLVDVRNPDEFAAQHIAGSVNLPLDRCASGCTTLPQGKKIIVHCLFGKRGASACETMCSQRDDLQLYNIEGGLMAWQTAGLEVENKVSGPQKMSVQRQFQIALGLLLVVFTALGFLLGPVFYWMLGLVGLGLINAGRTGWCGITKALRYMPWNKV